MSDVVSFLEALGRDAMTGNGLAAEGYASRVEVLDIDDDQRTALINRDADALGRLLQGRQVMLCSVFPADEPQREGEGDEPDDRPDDSPAEDE